MTGTDTTRELNVQRLVLRTDSDTLARMAQWYEEQRQLHEARVQRQLALARLHS